MRGTILQPTYLPWLGYFEMIDATDIFVVFDHVQFVKKSWQHRNRTKNANGQCLISIPVVKAPRETAIKDIKMSFHDRQPLIDHWRTISHSYQKAPYFSTYKESIEALYSQQYLKLISFTVKLIQTLCELLGITTQMVYSSSLDLHDENLGKTEKVVNLCKKVGLSYLYDTHGAMEFIEVEKFKVAGIDIEFQRYEHPTYNQLFGEFIPYMSVIDLLFNEGDNSLAIIRSGRKTPVR